MNVPIEKIIIGEGRRELRDVDELAKSIQEIGLLNPITITKDFRLIAGYHRLTACKKLGWTEIPANVVDMDALKAELAEIDENLIRNELTVLERAEQLKRRKEIYEELYPETKSVTERGGPGRGHKTNADSALVFRPPTFTEDTAKKTGRSQRAVQEEVQIATHLDDEVKDMIRDTELADRKTDLLKLARMDKEEQKKVAEKIRSGEAKDIKTAFREIKREEAEKMAQAIESVAVAVKEKPVEVEPGDFWRLGDHILYCGDTSDPVFIEKAPKAPFAFADPPYNANAAEWDNGFIWNHDWLQEKAEVVAVTPGIVSIFDFARRTKMPYRWSVACWITNGMTRGALGFGNWIYVALFSNGDLYRCSQDFLSVTIRNNETAETDHKGRKPTELLLWLFDRFAKPGEWVIDPFLGSGTTLLAAEKKGMKCYGGEINPEFCRDIIERWQAMTGKKAVKDLG